MPAAPLSGNHVDTPRETVDIHSAACTDERTNCSEGPKPTCNAVSRGMLQMRKTVSVIMTVKNDRAGCAVTLDSLRAQTRQPDQIIVVDGGSTDGTVDVIDRYAAADSRVVVVQAPGVNIARGRNLAAETAIGGVIACTDCGCRAEPDWLQKLVAPFEQDADVEFVAGFYRIETHTLLEQVVGLATMRGQLEPADPETFNPSARSMACTKALWSRAGGWPEWICFSEDTLFDHKVRRMKAGWRFAGDAIVHWRPRSSLRAVARQFYNYGTGRGHTQINSSSFTYNLRNMLMCLTVTSLCFATLWALPFLAALIAYFYIWAFHRKGVLIVSRTRQILAYLIHLCVCWVVLVSNVTGYLVGSWQRLRDRDRYRRRMEAYLAGT